MGIFGKLKELANKTNINYKNDIVEDYFANFDKISSKVSDYSCSGFLSKYNSKITLCKADDGQRKPILKSENVISWQGLIPYTKDMGGTIKAVIKEGEINCSIEKGVLSVYLGSDFCGKCDLVNKTITTKEGELLSIEAPELQPLSISIPGIYAKTFDALINIKKNDKVVCTINIQSNSRRFFTNPAPNTTDSEKAIFTAMLLYRYTSYLNRHGSSRRF